MSPPAFALPRRLAEGNQKTEERLAAIEARWPGGSWDYRGQNRWQAWGFSFYTAVIGSAALIVSPYLDIALWTCHPMSPLSPFDLTPRLGLALALLALFGGWCLDRFLAGKTPGALRVPRWLLASRAVLAVLPVFGLVIVPTWRWLLANRPRRAFSALRAVPLELADPAPRRSRPLAILLTDWQRRAMQSPGMLILWLVFCQILPFQAGISALGARGRGPGLLAGWVVVHFTLGACATHLVLNLSRRRLILGWRRYLFWIVAGSLVLPLPFWLPGALFAWPLSLEEREQKTLSWTAYKLLRERDSRPRPTSRSGWKAFRWAMQGADLPLPWSRSTGEAGGIEARRGALARLKSLALLGEAALLAWWIALLRHGHPLLQDASSARLLYLALILPALGLVVEVFYFSRSIADRIRGHAISRYRSFGRSLAVTQATFAVGFLSGCLAAGNAYSTLGWLLFLTGLAGFLGTLLLLLPEFFLGRPGRPGFLTSAAWAFLLASLSIAGAVVAAENERAVWVERAAWAMPVLGFAAAVLFSADLLHPQSWRDLFRRRLRHRERAILFFLALTALLPLGGLAVPGWDWARRKLPAAPDAS